ncbi:hypothetical protein [Mycoplasma sp. P36-A1]|uniref:hypothetical protein n=1 Tax=Mycoplasma sp. P36-A1 TaxID=3252900 RepID=UPI003C305FAC
MKKILLIALSIILCSCSAQNDTKLSSNNEKENLTLKKFNSELLVPMGNETSQENYIFKDALIDFTIKVESHEKKDECLFVEGVFNESLELPVKAKAYICNIDLKKNTEQKVNGYVKGLKTIEYDENNHKTYLVLEHIN